MARKGPTGAWRSTLIPVGLLLVALVVAAGDATIWVACAAAVLVIPIAACLATRSVMLSVEMAGSGAICAMAATPLIVLVAWEDSTAPPAAEYNVTRLSASWILVLVPAAWALAVAGIEAWRRWVLDGPDSSRVDRRGVARWSVWPLAAICAACAVIAAAGLLRSAAVPGPHRYTATLEPPTIEVEPQRLRRWLVDERTEHLRLTSREGAELRLRRSCGPGRCLEWMVDDATPLDPKLEELGPRKSDHVEFRYDPARQRWCAPNHRGTYVATCRTTSTLFLSEAELASELEIVPRLWSGASLLGLLVALGFLALGLLRRRQLDAVAAMSAAEVTEKGTLELADGTTAELDSAHPPGPVIVRVEERNKGGYRAQAHRSVLEIRSGDKDRLVREATLRTLAAYASSAAALTVTMAPTLVAIASWP